MSLFLGLDGGQSSTTAMIGDEQGRVLGIGRSGPCNHVKSGDGREKFLRAVRGSIDAAAAAAGLGSDGLRYAGACLGFSGGPADKQALVEEMVAAERLLVTNDAVIALAGATGGQPGIIVIGGTGSIALGRDAAGKVARAGGWGYVFGDEGGGFDITRQALRAALQMEEGWGSATMLRDVLLGATGAQNVNEVLHWFYTTDYPRDRVAKYSKLVDDAAQAGDAMAQEILQRAAQQLATFVGAVKGQLFGPEETVRVSPIGGVFKSERLRERFRMLVELSDGEFALPKYGPAAGALLEAYRLAGVPVELQDVPMEKEY